VALIKVEKETMVAVAAAADTSAAVVVVTTLAVVEVQDLSVVPESLVH
jgi:hypothetical protein